MMDLYTLPVARKPITAGQIKLLGDQPIRVVCVWWGSKYSANYVKALFNGLSRHLPPEVQGNWDFTVITDRPNVDFLRSYSQGTPIRVVPVGVSEGWWQKIEMFRPDLFDLGDRCVYFDLDVAIIGDLTPIVAADVDSTPLVMITNFGPNRAQSAHNSSVMAWSPNETLSGLWRYFQDRASEIVAKLHGDQCYIWRYCTARRYPIHDFASDAAISYKYTAVNSKHLPKGARVVVFHGDPKPDKLNPPPAFMKDYLNDFLS